jgi:hypothetical protein
VSRSLLRLLERHAAAAAALRRAEAAYREAGRARPAADSTRARRAAADRAGAAFEVLAESVVELQSARAAVLAHAVEEGLSADRIGSFDEAFARTDRELGAYLAARTYDQVRATANSRA